MITEQQQRTNTVIQDTEDYRDHIATVDQAGKRIWMYPKKPSGRYYNARTWVTLAFLAIFLTLPFIKVNGEQFVLFNVLERKFVLFGLLFGPQDFYLFVLASLTFVVFIILFTVVYGRLFCGWVCPQTVFMEMIFRKIEYWIEGDANEQRKLDKAPWTRDKVRKRVLKHAIFFAFSVVVANYFLAYIIGMDEVRRIAGEPLGQHFGGFVSMLAFSGVFYFVFARLREQVCTTICPYGRLQGVLLVKESIVVAYDYQRGEPRGKLKKGGSPGSPASPAEASAKAGASNPVQQIRDMVGTVSTTVAEPAISFVDRSSNGSGQPAPANGAGNPAFAKATAGKGDCVDCKLCIAVCPTGIDIRNGTQLECVNCTACIDACDAVMDKIGKPRGLIRYDSMVGIESGRRKLFTTRVLAYTAVLLALVALDVFLFASRGSIESIILRSPGQLYQQRDETHVTNLYTYQFINKTSAMLPVELRLVEPTGGKVEFVGQAPAAMEKGGRLQGAFFVELPTDALQGRKTALRLEVYSAGKKIDEVKTNFMGPGKR
jgi:polyferredoxin